MQDQQVARRQMSTVRIVLMGMYGWSRRGSIPSLTNENGPTLGE